PEGHAAPKCADREDLTIAKSSISAVRITTRGSLRARMARIHRPQPWAAQAALIPLPEGARRRVCLVLPNSPSVLLLGGPVDRVRHSCLVLLRRTARRHIRAAAAARGSRTRYRRVCFLVGTLPVVLHLLLRDRRHLCRLLDDLHAP